MPCRCLVMAQHLWTPALLLSLVKMSRNIFHSGTELSCLVVDETLDTRRQSFVFTSTHLTTTPHPPMCGSLKRFLHASMEEPSFYQQQEDQECVATGKSEPACPSASPGHHLDEHVESPPENLLSQYTGDSSRSAAGVQAQVPQRKGALQKARCDLCKHSPADRYQGGCSHFFNSVTKCTEEVCMCICVYSHDTDSPK